MSDQVMVPVYHLNYIFYCDYFSQSSSNYYARRGGHPTSDLACGALNVNMYVSYTRGYSISGACISFKQIIVEDPAKSSTIITEKERTK